MIFPTPPPTTKNRPYLDSWYESALSRQGQVRGGAGSRTVTTVSGRTITLADQGGPWRHPWHTRLNWDGALNEWVATVKPGFVNGRCPVVAMTLQEAQTSDDYGINPLTGKPYFSDPIFNKNQAKTAEQTIAIPLYMRPAIRLFWENYGWDGQANFPDFFRNLGVSNPPANGGLALDGEPVNVSDTRPPAGNRLLRAADIILHQPRPALTSTITLMPGIATGISNAMQVLGLRDPAPGDALKVFCGKLTDQNAAGIDPLAGDYEEPTYDELLVSTVYLLSPPDTAPLSAPDSRWTPYVRHGHGMFWNLSYVTPPFEIVAEDLSNAFTALTTVASLLGGGAASFAVNFAAAGLNDIARNALNMILAHSMAGSFYTATSGGVVSTFPDITTNKAADNSGLAKSQRQDAQRKAQAKSKVSAKLDPSFPYEGIQFPTKFLE